MPTKKHLVIAVAATVLSLPFMGCVPSDAEIASDMSASRRAAYMEWKTARERGQTREAKVDGALSLDDAIRLALQYNKPLQIVIEEREVERGNRIAAYAVVLPSITLSGNMGRAEHAGKNNYSTGFTVQQPIFDGEAIPAKLRQARFYTALADETIRQQVQELIQAVANNYYDVLLAQHLVETHREALISAEAQYRMVSEKKKQETATDYDVLRAQVDVATYRARMISQQNAVDTNRVQLLKNMGVSQDSQITFSDKLEFLPMRPVFERAVEIASGNRPDLRQAELTARIYEEAVRIARSAFWPSISASFTQDWSGGTRNNAFRNNPWQAGVGGGLTFGADRVGDLISARAEARQKQITILDYQEEMLRQIRQEMNNLTNAEEMIKALEVNQDAAREALRLVLVGYQAGVKTEVDVTDARKALTDVQGEYYTSLADHTKARLNLQVAMGVLGPTCVSDGSPLPPRVPIANIEEFAATDYEPPQPIPMPTADDLMPVTRTRREAPVSSAAPARAPAARQAPAQRRENVAPAAQAPVRAAQAAPVRQSPAASATVEGTDKYGSAVTTPVAENVPAAPRPAVSTGNTGSTDSGQLSLPVETSAVPAGVESAREPQAQPLFKVRSGGAGASGTRLASAGN